MAFTSFGLPASKSQYFIQQAAARTSRSTMHFDAILSPMKCTPSLSSNAFLRLTRVDSGSCHTCTYMHINFAIRNMLEKGEMTVIVLIVLWLLNSLGTCILEQHTHPKHGRVHTQVPENPPILRSCATTLWHGTCGAKGFRLSAYRQYLLSALQTHTAQ